MRRHFWQFLVTDDGTPIENAEISIFYAGTETPVFVFTDELGPTGTATVPQVNTSRKGFFEFWIADDAEPQGYSLNTKFKIAWYAVGVSEGYIDYVDVFDASTEPVDETDIGIRRNKTVSNLLAKTWEDHRKHDVMVQGYPIHGILPVDEGDPDDTSINKLVSNAMTFNWETHGSTIYDPVTDSWVSSNDVNAPDPHGIGFIDTTSTDTEKNKLVSNALGRLWERHRTNASEDHVQYALLNGTRDFTAPVGYTGTVTYTSLGSNDFVTKGHMDGLSYYTTVNSVDWNLVSNNIYTVTINHNKNISNPCNITVWKVNPDTTVDVISPYDIRYADSNNIIIRMYGNNHQLHVRLNW